MNQPQSPNNRYQPSEMGNGLLNTSPMPIFMHERTPGKDQSEETKKYEVYMRCVTWSRDSHGLFDYESKNIAKKNIKTQTGGKILRVNDDVEFVSIRSKPEDIHEAAKPMIIVR